MSADANDCPETTLRSNFDWDRVTYLEQRQRGTPPAVPEHIRLRLPILDDFRIVLSPHDEGYLAVEFWSARLGFIVHGFPWRDFLAEEFLTSQELLFGIGADDDPLIEIDMGQELFIWRAGPDVLVIQGDPESDPGAFRVALRVPEDVFAGEWWRMVKAVRRYAGPTAPTE